MRGCLYCLFVNIRIQPQIPHLHRMVKRTDRFPSEIHAVDAKLRQRLCGKITVGKSVGKHIIKIRTDVNLHMNPFAAGIGLALFIQRTTGIFVNVL